MLPLILITGTKLDSFMVYESGAELERSSSVKGTGMGNRQWICELEGKESLERRAGAWLVGHDDEQQCDVA